MSVRDDPDAALSTILNTGYLDRVSLLFPTKAFASGVHNDIAGLSVKASLEGSNLDGILEKYRNSQQPRYINLTNEIERLSSRINPNDWKKTQLEILKSDHDPHKDCPEGDDNDFCSCPTISNCIVSGQSAHNLATKRAMRLDLAGVRRLLKTLHSGSYLPEEFTKVRILIWVLRLHLIRIGLAPRWHPSFVTDTNHLRALLERDDHYVDLYWLALRWPNHTTETQLWQRLFDEGYSGPIADKIIARRINKAKKIRLLALDEAQQYTSRHFCSREVEEQRGRISNMARTEEGRQRKRQVTSKNNEPSEQNIKKRLTVYECGLLVNWKNSKMRALLLMMTGEEMSRQLMGHYANSDIFNSQKTRNFTLCIPKIKRP